MRLDDIPALGLPGLTDPVILPEPTLIVRGSLMVARPVATQELPKLRAVVVVFTPWTRTTEGPGALYTYRVATSLN